MTTATASRRSRSRRPARYVPTVADKVEALLANTQLWMPGRVNGHIRCYLIPSTTTANKWYQVTPDRCECQASQKGADCCHRISAAIFAEERKAGGYPPPLAATNHCEDCGVAIPTDRKVCRPCLEAFMALVCGEPVVPAPPTIVAEAA